MPEAQTAVEVMRGVYDAYLRGDQAAVDAAFASNVRVAIPGSSDAAGEYVGFDRARAIRARLEGRYDPSTVRVTEISPVTDDVARLEVEFAGRDEQESFPIRLSQWFRLDGRGKIREVTLEPQDLKAWDRLFQATA